MGLNSAYFDGLLLEQIWNEYECTKKDKKYMWLL